MKFRIKNKNNRKLLLAYILSCIAVTLIALAFVINGLKDNKEENENILTAVSDATIIIKKHTASNTVPEKKEPENETPPEIIENTTEPVAPIKPTPDPTPAPAPAPVIPDANTDIATYVQSLHVTGIGDSIMLGAVPSLYAIFPSGYFDAAVSRQIIHAYDIITSLNNSGLLGDPIIINLGANGFYNDDYKKAVISMLEGKEVFWLTVTNNHMVGINDSLRALGNEIPNLHIIDWEAISIGHPEYFGADGIHLTGTGQIAYANAIYSALCDFYIQKYPELSK